VASVNPVSMSNPVVCCGSDKEEAAFKAAQVQTTTTFLLLDYCTYLSKLSFWNSVNNKISFTSDIIRFTVQLIEY
jgi:hypothetical protein